MMQTFFLEGSLWGSAVARAVLAVPCPSPTCSGHARRAALGAHAPRGCCSSVLRGGRGRGCGGARAPASQFHPCLTLKTPPFGHRSGRRVAAEAVRRAPGRSGEQCVMRADALPPWPRTLTCMPLVLSARLRAIAPHCRQLQQEAMQIYRRAAYCSASISATP